MQDILGIIILLVLAVFVYKVAQAWWHHRVRERKRELLRKQIRERIEGKPYEPRFGYGPRKWH